MILHVNVFSLVYENFPSIFTFKNIATHFFNKATPRSSPDEISYKILINNSTQLNFNNETLVEKLITIHKNNLFIFIFFETGSKFYQH